MDITALSAPIAQANLRERVGIAVLKMAMDSAQAQNEGLIKILEETRRAMEISVQPYLGGNIDLNVYFKIPPKGFFENSDINNEAKQGKFRRTL